MIRFFILITSLCFLLTGCQPSQSNDKSEKINNEVENSSSISDNTTSISQIQTTENISNISNAISPDVNNVTNENTNTSNTTTSSSSDSSPKETELASFTTKIYTKEEARQKIEDLGQYLCYDDEDIHFDTNINNLEEYFYQDETYITGNLALR